MLNIARFETMYLRLPFWSSYTLHSNRYILALQLAQYQAHQPTKHFSFLLLFCLLSYTSSDCMEQAL